MLDRPYTNSIADALDIADMDHWTRQPPRSDQARLRFLLTRHQDTTTLAAQLHTTPAVVQDILRSRQSTQSGPLHQATTKEIIRLWQPRVRRRAHREVLASQHRGLTVHFRAWFGFAGAAGTSDDGRTRRITEQVPAPYTDRLFQARYRNADEQELRTIVGDAVGEAYFKVSPMGKLHMVTLTDIEYVELWY